MGQASNRAEALTPRSDVCSLVQPPHPPCKCAHSLGLARSPCIRDPSQAAFLDDVNLGDRPNFGKKAIFEIVEEPIDNEDSLHRVNHLASPEMGRGARLE